MSRDALDRRLAAILSADVVGYSRLMAEDEAGTARTLAAYRDEIGLLVRQHRGRVVDSPGDNLLAEFPTATDAVECGVAIQRVVGARNASLAADRKLEFRIGVHVGEVTFEPDRIYGNGVNIAARLQALAEPGGICVSGAVQEQVGKKLAVSYRDLGPQSLKNIPEPVRAYQVRGDEPATAPKLAPRGPRWGVVFATAVVAAAAIFAGWRLLGPGGASAPPGPIRSLAVLPLENLSGDPEQEYFADGMTEELIGELAKIRALRVISRTSVMRYKQTDKSIPEIAAELGVEGALEGTVTREQGRIRVTVQLIDGRTDTHLWAERFDRELNSVLALQSDIARAVAEQLRVELTPGEQAALVASQTVDPRAYDAYLRGLEARGSGVSFLPLLWAPRAIEEFERAVELDPDFAEAWAALAFAREWLGETEPRYRHEVPKARAAALRALELDDSIGAAHATLGSILIHDWDFEAARRAYERALEVSPGDPTTLNGCAFYLLMIGRPEEALRLMERLQRVAPFDRFYRGVRVRNFSWARQYQRALEELARVRELDPSFVEFELVTAYFHLGQLEDAHRAHVALYQQCGPSCARMQEASERGWSEAGFSASIRALAEAAEKQEGYPPFLVAAWYSLIGETEKAFSWLERGYRQHDPFMVHLKLAASFDPLRSDPRFQDLLRRIGFPEG